MAKSVEHGIRGSAKKAIEYGVRGSSKDPVKYKVQGSGSKSTVDHCVCTPKSDFSIAHFGRGTEGEDY